MINDGDRVSTHGFQVSPPRRNPAELGLPASDSSAPLPEPSASTVHILIANQQTMLEIDLDRMRTVTRQILEDARITSGALSIAIVDNPTIHRLNQQYLQHDWPTDVLSFPLEERPGHLEGEVVVSAEVASTTAAEVPWAGTEELLLYVIHGTLHLVGYRDKRPEESARMRAAELTYLRGAGVTVTAQDDRWRVARPDKTVSGGGLQTS